MKPFAVVDTHVHLWDPERLRYTWLESVPVLNKIFGLDELHAATAGIPIERFVFVQCECDPIHAHDEAVWIAELAQAEPRIQGIVAYAPIELGDGARASIAALARIPLVKGVRRMLNETGMCLTPSFIRGLEILADHGLSFDLGTVPKVLPEIIELVRRCPQVRFMLDHLGKPDIRGGRLREWQEHAAELAGSANVFCKLSGLATEADRKNWSDGDLHPYLDAALRSFGPERLTWGGDWPVVTLASSYRRWFEAFCAWQIPDEQRRKILHDNALDFYRLPAETATTAKGTR
jgi:L-fuconolactonase